VAAISGDLLPGRSGQPEAKIDAGNIGKHIETVRISPEAKETAAILEVFRANALNWCAKFSKRSIH